MTSCLSLLCFMVFGPPGVAFSDLSGVSQAPRSSVQSFGQAHDQCVAWTDGCVTCTKAAGGAAQCSTPGIACTARAVACTAP